VPDKISKTVEIVLAEFFGLGLSLQFSTWINPILIGIKELISLHGVCRLKEGPKFAWFIVDLVCGRRKKQEKNDDGKKRARRTCRRLGIRCAVKVCGRERKETKTNSRVGHSISHSERINKLKSNLCNGESENGLEKSKFDGATRRFPARDEL
jgi:hypothetical protein